MAPMDGELSLRGPRSGSRTPFRNYVEALRSLEQWLDRRRADVVVASTRRRGAELGLQIYMGPRCVLLRLCAETDRFRERGGCVSRLGSGCVRTRRSTADHV